jgi:tetratricopeptide (TPR) repeat protein
MRSGPLLLLLLVAPPAVAQEGGSDELTGVAGPEAPELEGVEREAREVFTAGQVAFAEGRYENALGYFTRAYELSGHPEMLFNIGTTADRLERSGEALEAFERYLEERPDAPNRAAVEPRIAALRDRVRQEEREARERERLEADLAASQGPGAAPWILFAAGAVVATGGGVLLGLALVDRSQVEGIEVGTRWSEVESQADRVKPFSTIGIVALAAGGAAAGVGLVWALAASGAADHEATSVSVGAGFLTIRGGF